MSMKLKEYTNLTLISPISIYYPHPQKHNGVCPNLILFLCFPSQNIRQMFHIAGKRKLLLGGITLFTGSIKLRFLYFKHITLNKINNKKYKELILK